MDVYTSHSVITLEVLDFGPVHLSLSTARKCGGALGGVDSFVNVPHLDNEEREKPDFFFVERN